MISCANPFQQFKSYQTEIENAVVSVMRGNNYVLGEQVRLLENEFANYIGVNSAIGVANGTDAIELALRALNIGFGDDVITVSHTAVATVAAIEATGANAVLLDIDPQTYTLNPHQLKNYLTNKTKAVVAVHLYGNAVDLEAITKFCDFNQIYLIEDVSQAHGAKYKNKRLGSFGDIACFSCYPTKNLGAIGDAGLVVSNNLELANKVRMLREYGWEERVSMHPGRNSRLDEIQAAVLRVKLKYLDSDNDKRRKLANYYFDNLTLLPIVLPEIRPNTESVFHLFVVQVDNRQSLIDFLKLKGINIGIHYPFPVHIQPAYIKRVKTADNMSVTESLANKIISLPMYPELSLDSAEKIVSALKSFFVREKS
jgi:dTDP-4-amino-4,6-dideoxygalactose transaminase